MPPNGLLNDMKELEGKGGSDRLTTSEGKIRELRGKKTLGVEEGGRSEIRMPSGGRVAWKRAMIGIV